MRKLTALCFIILMTQTGYAQNSCDRVFQNEFKLLLTENKSQVAAQSVQKFFKRQGRELYYRVDTPPKKVTRTVVLIHGLGDHSGRLNGLADELLSSGARVIRVDLHGHGRSLEKSIQAGKSADEPVIFQNQVDDIVALLSRLELRSYTLVGHSYGGGVASAVAARVSQNFTGRNPPLKKLIMIAPFVVDLRTYYKSGLLSREAAWDRYIKLMSPIPWAQDVITMRKTAFDYFINQSMTGFREVYKKSRPMTSASTQLLKDRMDIATDQMIESSYEKYFNKFAIQEGFEGHPLLEQSVKTEATASVRAMEGISGYSFFAPEFAVWNPKIKTVIVAGQKDPLVPVDLLKKAKLHLENLGLEVAFETVDSGHMVPQSEPQHVSKIIRGN